MEMQQWKRRPESWPTKSRTGGELNIELTEDEDEGPRTEDRRQDAGLWHQRLPFQVFTGNGLMMTSSCDLVVIVDVAPWRLTHQSHCTAVIIYRAAKSQQTSLDWTNSLFQSCEKSLDEISRRGFDQRLSTWYQAFVYALILKTSSHWVSTKPRW